MPENQPPAPDGKKTIIGQVFDATVSEERDPNALNIIVETPPAAAKATSAETAPDMSEAEAIQEINDLLDEVGEIQKRLNAGFDQIRAEVRAGGRYNDNALRPLLDQLQDIIESTVSIEDKVRNNNYGSDSQTIVRRLSDAVNVAVRSLQAFYSEFSAKATVGTTATPPNPVVTPPNPVVTPPNPSPVRPTETLTNASERLDTILQQRIDQLDAVIAGKVKDRGFGFDAMETARGWYDGLAAYKLVKNDDWRDPDKTAFIGRFLIGNLDGRSAVKLVLAAGSLGAFAGGFAALGTGLAVARSLAGGVMGYFTGERIMRDRKERQMDHNGNAPVLTPNDLPNTPNDTLIDLIARMEYQAIVSGKSLNTKNTADNTKSVDPRYAALTAELKRRSSEAGSAPSPEAAALEAALNNNTQAVDGRLRQLLQSREDIDRVAKIAGSTMAAVVALGPSVLHGAWEAAWGGVGYDGYSVVHGMAKPIIGSDSAQYISGTGAYSPDAVAAAVQGGAVDGVGLEQSRVVVGALEDSVRPAPSGIGGADAIAQTTTPSGPPPVPQASGPMAIPVGPETPATSVSGPAVTQGPELAAAATPTPEPGSFVPTQAEFDKYIIGKIDINDAGVTPDQVNNGFSYIFKRQLMDHAQEYGWDGTGNKEKWAMRRLMEIMKEVKINGQTVYDAQQLWATDDAVGKAYILEMDGDGKFSVDVYQKSGTNWVSYDGQGADTQVMPLDNAQGSGNGAGQGGGQVAPDPAPQATGQVGDVLDKNGKLSTGGTGYSGDLAPNANNKVQWYDQAGFKSEGGYKDSMFSQIHTKAGMQETWTFGATDPSSDISQQLWVNHTLPLDKAGSTGVKFSDNFKSVEDFTGSVSNYIKEKLFNPGHPPFTGRFGRLADEYAQLRQAEYVLGKSNSLNPSVISPNEIAAMKKAIARELAERVKKLAEFEGVLKEDIRPARIFGKN